jgi:predicted  nucleic acid-binding Zn-ribbon protein
LRGAPDGGSTAGGNPALSSADGGAALGLEEQVSTLRARIAQLEQRADSDRGQAQQLQEMNTQLRALGQQATDAQARRAASEAQAASSMAQRQEAVDGLGAALSQLQSGNGDIASALDAGDLAFPPQARLELAAARAALANKNLGEARALLEAAIAHARAGR